MPLPTLDEVRQAFPSLPNIHQFDRGGMKLVYRATHPSYGEVALKLIPDPQFNPRVEREIEVAQNCRFTNFPALYESGTLDLPSGTVVYLVEQFIEGENLRNYLKREHQMPLSLTLALLESLLVTAVESEEQGLVHRDIKPENIIIGTDGRFWILDFGVARHLGRTSLTATGYGAPLTLGYAAPEQLRALKREIDIRADLFSIGVVAYETITGSHPFTTGARDPFDVRRRTEHLNVPMITVPGDSQRQLAGFIGILMEKFPSRRPPDAKTALEWYKALVPTLRLV